MDAIIPEHLKNDSSTEYLKSVGFKRMYQGGARDLFEIPGRPDWLLLYSSDRLSIGNFVLCDTAPFKGDAYIALVHYWFIRRYPEFPSHLAWSSKLPGRNAVFDLLEKFPEVPLSRTVVVEKKDVLAHQEYLKHATEWHFPGIAPKDEPFLRDWGSSIVTPFYDQEYRVIVGIDNLDPLNSEHVKWVQQIRLPTVLLASVGRAYLDLVKDLTEHTIGQYQTKYFMQ